MKKLIILVAMSLSLLACDQKAPAPQVVGGDVDVHGCKPSAGYQWSILRTECIRIFEQGLRLNPVNTQETSSAFIILAADNSQLELFIPTEQQALILDKAATDSSWSHGKYQVTEKNGHYTLLFDGKPMYLSANP